MAKILFFNIPAHGHVNPTLPVVTELVQQGHHVIYYDTPSFASVIQNTGAEFRLYPNAAEAEAEFGRRISNLPSVTVYLLEQSLQWLPFVLAELDQEQPDLVMFDAIALWGMQAAHLRQLPAIASIGLLIQEGVSRSLTWRDYAHMLRKASPHIFSILRRHRQLTKRYGAAVFPNKGILPCTGDLTLVYTSREFQPETPFINDSFRFVGPSILPAARTQVAFPWERLDPDQPKIYLSLGTLYNDNADFYQAVCDAFADYPAQLILSIGRRIDPQRLKPLPPNCLVQSTVPQLELLSNVDLFITHGGMNSVSEGLYYGVPLVTIPQQNEQAFNGRQVAQHGAGVVLADQPPYGRVSIPHLRQAVDQVLTNPSYRQKAAELRESFIAAGGYKTAAAIITAYCSSN